MSDYYEGWTTSASTTITYDYNWIDYKGYIAEQYGRYYREYMEQLDRTILGDLFIDYKETELKDNTKKLKIL